MASPSNKNAWEKEYENKLVPTSNKQHLSKSVTYFTDFLAIRRVSLKGTVLDCGCGNGRNGMYFLRLGCKVIGLDIAENALDEFHKTAVNEGLASNLKLLQQSMAEKYPQDDSSIDFAICLTSIEGLHTDEELGKFRAEVFRVLKPGGLFLLYFLTPNDGYYAPFITSRKPTIIAYSPQTGITVRLYSVNEIKSIFSDDFTLEDSKEFDFPDVVAGKEYPRALAALILRKEK